MATTRKPRAGSMQFWPRVKAKRIYPRIRKWPIKKETKLLGFAGYKSGMTHVQFIDKTNSTTKNDLITCPVTVLECPPLKIAALRFYKKTNYGLKIKEEFFLESLDKSLKKKITLPKKKKEFDEKKLENYNDLRILTYTQPRLTHIRKKKPELFELAISGNSVKEKYDFVKNLFNKEIKVSDVFKEGQTLDVHAVTTGKGFQGAVKRFGISLKPHKTEKGRRRPGSLGPWCGQGHVMWRVAHAGQTGFHTRTEYNKWLLKISDKPEEINPKGGFLHYGLIKNDFILIKGSIPGPKKRLIRLVEPIRKESKILSPEISYISTSSKQ